MKILELESGKEPEQILKSSVNEDDFKPLREVYPGTIVTQSGLPILIYGKFETSHDDLIDRIRNIKFSTHIRLTNLREDGSTHERESSYNFGFTPPSGVYARPACACIFNTKYPRTYELLVGLGEELRTLMKLYNPTLCESFEKRVADLIKPQWLIPGTSYTQGVINNANNLKYHYDRDNVDGGWSAMVYFKKQVRGGNLIVPSLGCKLMCEDNSYMFFDGQSLIHGVTPIIRTSPEAFRYSLVYYARKSMSGLGSYDHERIRAQGVELRKHQRRLEKP